MKKNKEVPQTRNTYKPPKANLTDEEIRRRLKNIDEWRKKRLATIKPHIKDSR